MNAAEIDTRRAGVDDFPAIVALLQASGLPTDDLSPASFSDSATTRFSVAFSGPRLIATCGLEASGCDGLLRSLAVAPGYRHLGVGRTLVEHSESAARTAGIDTLYLLTTSAATYLSRLGYTGVSREAVPAGITGHPQFRGLCPASATCLKKALA